MVTCEARARASDSLGAAAWIQAFTRTSGLFQPCTLIDPFDPGLTEFIGALASLLLPHFGVADQVVYVKVLR